MRFTVVVQGHEDWGGCLVFAVTGSSVIIAPPPDAVLRAFPLGDCRVAARFDSLEERAWWNAILEAGERERVNGVTNDG